MGARAAKRAEERDVEAEISAELAECRQAALRPVTDDEEAENDR